MRGLGFAWFLNILLGAAIGSAWLRASPIEGGFASTLFAVAALLSTIATLASIPAILLWVLGWILPGKRAIAWVQAATWTTFHLVLFADTRVYALYKYHFNGMIWNLLTSPGGRETIELGAGTLALVAFAAAALFALELLVWNRWLSHLRGLDPKTPRGARVRRAWIAGCAAVVAVVMLDKGLYAAADLGRERRITVLSRLFPLYQRLTVQRFARNVFGMKLEERPAVALSDEGLLLRYPLEAPVVDPPAKMPNVLILVVDSLRADMLDERTMPEIARYARGGRRFEDHLSGGNATRFGIFSLLYGIHGAYWMPVYEERAPPVLVTTLQRLGYDMRVISTATMNFPEFRSTAWVSIEGSVDDAMPGKTKYEKDQEVARRFDAWLSARAARGAAEPFFCFAMLDAPHGNYSWPPEETRFEPFTERVDFLAMSGKPAPAEVERVFNSYRNAVYFADGVLGRMLMSLRNHGAAEDTIVVITGDHGEEFLEHGYFGHSSNFTPEQVRVPFVLAGPGIEPGVETRPTSHVDLVPTLLERLGAAPSARESYTHGVSLLDPPAARDRVIASWEEVALWVDGGILRIPLEGHRGFIEGYAYDWTRLEDRDEDGLIAREGAVVARLAFECRSFLR